MAALLKVLQRNRTNQKSIYLFTYPYTFIYTYL
jgi:hypothetical protein